jgi:hypothetical protein
MKQSLKIGFVAVVVAAVAASGLAFAQSNGGGDTLPPADTAQVEEFEGRFERGPRGKHRGGHHLEQVAEFLGIDDPAEIRETLEAGGTLADVAEANGSSGAALVTELVTGLEEKLADAVADERITQERADEILGEATEKITTMVNSTQEEIRALREAERAEREAEREARRAERQQVLEDVIGIPFEDIQAALEGGETTLAEIAAEQGVDLETLVDGLVAPAAADLADRVAEGILTQEEADERLADITERITERVQTEPGDRPGHHRGRHGPGRGGPGFGGFGGEPGSPSVEGSELSLNA